MTKAITLTEEQVEFLRTYGNVFIAADGTEVFELTTHFRHRSSTGTWEAIYSPADYLKAKIAASQNAETAAKQVKNG